MPRLYLAHISQVRLLLRAAGALTLRLIRVGHGPLCGPIPRLYLP